MTITSNSDLHCGGFLVLAVKEPPVLPPSPCRESTKTAFCGGFLVLAERKAPVLPVSFTANPQKQHSTAVSLYSRKRVEQRGKKQRRKKHPTEGGRRKQTGSNGRFGLSVNGDGSRGNSFNYCTLTIGGLVPLTQQPIPPECQVASL